jgi:hypothetical protein
MTEATLIRPKVDTASFGWSFDKPVYLNFFIQGPTGLANYTPPGLALIKSYDPFLGRTVYRQVPIGGQGGNYVSVLTG